MARAIKVISVEKGFDVRDYTLVSFGGAGGLHACELAESLLIKKILVPRNAGVLSALGMTLTDIIKDYSKSLLLKVKEKDYRKILNFFKPLILQGMKDVISEGISKSCISVENSVDMRYVGQSHDLMLPFKDSYIEDFHKLHKQTYGYSKTEYEIEVVNIRVRVIGKTRKPSMRKGVMVGSMKGLIKKTKFYFRGKWFKADVYIRNDIREYAKIKGPALIVEDTSTTFLPPDFICSIDNYENLIIKKK
jgi:N-methylhydantoinase A